MRRYTLPVLLVQFLLGMAGEAAAQTSRVVGKVIVRRPDVRGEIARKSELLESRSPIADRMQVATERYGRARIALGQGQQRRGSVELGPETQVRFFDSTVQGQSPAAVGLFLGFGDLRAMFSGGEPEIQPGEGETWILTPSGEVIPLGTDVSVRVDRRDGSTLVAVAEGRAVVRSKMGFTVELGPGEWTYVPIDGPPTPPRVIPPGDGEPPPGFPGDPFPVDPPQLDLRFDLPR